MGVQRFFFAAFLLSAMPGGFAVVSGQTVDGLKWTQDAIDKHAVMRFFDPPARHTDTKWQVVTLEGCQAELKQTVHRESPETVFNRQGIFGKSEDRTMIYTFDLHELKPAEIDSDTSAGLAHVKIFAHGDLFHVKTDSVSNTVSADGTVADTTNWSVSGHTSNLWIYFDSPEVDNKMMVRRVAVELQTAAEKCNPSPVVKRKRSPKSVIAAALR
jgi:hypothetical protein